jgi:hypothetical protein
MIDWPDHTKELTVKLRELRGSTPDVMKAFSAIAQSVSPQGLNPKMAAQAESNGVRIAA